MTTLCEIAFTFLSQFNFSDTIVTKVSDSFRCSEEKGLENSEIVKIETASARGHTYLARKSAATAGHQPMPPRSVTHMDFTQIDH